MKITLLNYSSQEFIPDIEHDIEDFDDALWFFYDMIINKKTKDFPNKSEFKKWLEVYSENFIKNELSGNKRNLLTFENQKLFFFSLIEKQYKKYGHNFSFIFKNDYNNKYDFLFLHTLFALKHLNYLDFKDLVSTEEDENRMGQYYVTKEVGYECKITLKQEGLDILKKLEKNSSEMTFNEKIETDSGKNEIKLRSGKLTIKENTGYVQLNNTENTLNLESNEFKTLLILVKKDSWQATYRELLGKDISKTKKRNLAFTIRNIKRALGILPLKKKNRNKDIIKNIKNYGYKFIT